MKRSDLFRRVEPPPGGLGRLRAAMRAPASQPRRWRWVASGALTAALASLAVLTRRPPAPARTEPVQLAAADRETAGLVRVPTADPQVVFYWVSRIDDGP